MTSAQLRHTLDFTPADLGFPAKFTGWRHVQDRAIANSLSWPLRALQQMQPTGSGKSGTYMADARLSSERAVILTATKLLQDQLTAEFSNIGVADLRGRGNYACVLSQSLGSRLSCHDGAQLRCPVRENHGRQQGGSQCPHKATLDRARTAPIAVLNYDTWLAAQIHHGQLGTPDLLILDECHAADDKLCDHLSVTVEPMDGRLLGAAVPYSASPAADFITWAAKHKPRAQSQVSILAGQAVDAVRRGTRPPSSLVSELRAWTKLHEKMETLEYLGKRSHSLIVSTVTHAGHFSGVRISPLWGAPFAEQYLFCQIPRLRLTSATCRPRTLDYLGLGAAESGHLDYPSPFPSRRSPIYYWGVARMSQKTEQESLPEVCAAIDQILRHRPGVKGLIHSVSYQRATDIHKLVRDKGRVLTHKPSESLAALAYWLDTSEPIVMCSPAMTTGLDLSYDRCEITIVPKLPFPNFRDPIVEARSETDPDYGLNLMAQQLMQSVGRPMRAADDHNETWILDSMWGSTRWRARHLLTPWFQNLLFAHPRIPPAPEPFLGRVKHQHPDPKSELDQLDDKEL